MQNEAKSCESSELYITGGGRHIVTHTAVHISCLDNLCYYLYQDRTVHTRTFTRMSCRDYRTYSLTIRELPLNYPDFNNLLGYLVVSLVSSILNEPLLLCKARLFQ